MLDGNQSAKVVAKSMRRTMILYQGHRLSEHDDLLMRTALQLQSALLLDLLPSERSWNRWVTFLGRPTIDIQSFSDTIKYADMVLKCYPSAYTDNYQLPGYDGVPRDVPGFKRQVRDRGLDWGFLSPVEALWDEYFICPAGPSCRTLNQWINFLSHVTLRDIDLKTSLLNEYVALEEEECGWVYEDTMLKELNRIMREWLQHLSFDACVPSHGPGSVANLTRNTGRLAKYAIMDSDIRLQYLLKDWYSDPTDMLPPGGFSDKSVLRRQSELVCVPKSMTKNRSISKEPCSLQYFQHGAQRRIDEYLKGHPVLSGRIDLHNQELSKLLAMKGSIRGDWATIDLSSASDSVTLHLVKGVFRGTPYLRPAICLRSDRTILPNGRIVELQKYAPMGSDLCFPTMCLVFACICEYVVRAQTGRASRLNDYRVYGDDIVLRQEFTEGVRTALLDLHFEVNSRKSFTDLGLHHFREACGGEYLDGVDVTPIRLSRRMHFNKSSNGFSLSSVEAVSSVVELMNSAFAEGMTNVRRALYALLGDYCSFRDKLPFTAVASLPTKKYGRSTYVLPTYSTAIETYPWCCTNFRVPSRHHGKYGTAGLQCMQYKIRKPCSPSKEPLTKYREHWTSDDVRYFEYWLTLPDRPRTIEFGVEFLPEPVTGLYPARPEWRDAWVLANA